MKKYCQELKTSDKITFLFTAFNFLSLIILLFSINIIYFFSWYSDQKTESMYDISTNYNIYVSNKSKESLKVFKDYVLKRNAVIIPENGGELICSSGIGTKIHSEIKKIKDKLFYSNKEKTFFVFTSYYEDNEILSRNIADYLKLEGIKSKQVYIGKNINYELSMDSYDLIILDLGLPDISGLEVCENIRNSNHNLPILMLTARSTIQDKLAGFDSGADDYLTKPFDYEELLMRIKALTKRNFKVKNILIELGNISVNLKEKEVRIDGEPIHLSKLEIELLIYLIHNKGTTVSKEQLLEKVWGEYDAFSMTRTVDVYIGYLRKKLGKDLIKTIRGEGYKIED